MILGLVYGYVPFMILPLYAFLDRIDGRLLEAARDLGSEPVPGVPPRHPAAVDAGDPRGHRIIALPMFGDYYTATCVSGSPTTTMIGNQIELYLRRARRRDRCGARARPVGLPDGADGVLPGARHSAAGREVGVSARGAGRGCLASITWLYIAWSLVPS